MPRSKEYQAAVAQAMIKAIVDSSKVDDSKMIAILSGEVAMACLDVIAFVTVKSELTSSPAKRRRFCDTVAKRLNAKIAGMQELGIIKNSSWLHAVNLKDLPE
jgi:hypothetical protein